jgi:hypothetical protein
VRKDGTRLWVSVVIDAVRNAAGEVVGFAKITRDVSHSVTLHPVSEAGGVSPMTRCSACNTTLGEANA